jgi:ribosomal protein S18 acetylase RimI-like enzyme
VPLRAPPAELTEAAVGTERRFVLASGGFSLELSGGSLVTHERIPVPRFNHVLVHPLSASRQSAFFEKALDHYFQRALRPTFRIVPPVPSHVDETLQRLAFRRRPEPYTLWWARPATPAPLAVGLEVREADPGELDSIVAFWTDGPNRAELRRALDVLWNHPNPGERLVPILAEQDGTLVGSAVALEQPPVVSLHGVAVAPEARSRGMGTSLVAFALGAFDVTRTHAIVLGTDSSRAGERLGPIGFSRLREFVEYELPADAQLAMPSPGPPQPPRWRPPREPALPSDGI